MTLVKVKSLQEHPQNRKGRNMETNLRTLAFEIGTEEIPAFDLMSATKQLEKLVPISLNEKRIEFESVAVYSTPRRLIVMICGLACLTRAVIEEAKGPSSMIAFDESGNPTKAAIGFAKGKGLNAEQLERRIVDGVEYVFARKEIPAQQAEDILPEILLQWIHAISWPKSMRWGTQNDLFSRPIRWILALLDDCVVPFEHAGLTSGNTTQGHRILAPGSHQVMQASELIETLKEQYVIAGFAEREARIRKGIKAIEAKIGAKAEIPEKTLTEVINLCEFPSPLVGTFDYEFLDVPEEIIVDAMLMHQRYFPLYDQNHKLINKFIAVSNGNPNYSDIIIDGNERVVRPRLSDAKFFFEEDLKHPLSYYVDDLDKVVFQESLGTMKDKTQRIVKVVSAIADNAGFDAARKTDALRAAYLSKADLVSNAVIEFTSVQGVMGAYYAEASGENKRVVEAIADQYRPRFSGDELPRNTIGKAVAIADKLDTVCGLFTLDQAPTGSSDPFALRRSAIGIINMIGEDLSLSLEAAIDASLATFENKTFDYATVKQSLLDFFVTRTKVMLRDGGYSADVIDAVLACGIFEPAEIMARTKSLVLLREEMPEVLFDLAAAYARANNIRQDDLGLVVDPSLMDKTEENLYDAVLLAEKRVEQSLAANDYAQSLHVLSDLRASVDQFLEEILIMDENIALRENHLRLLNRFIAVFAHIADFGKLAKSGK